MPYPQVPNDDLIDYLQKGNRMEQPKAASDDMYINEIPILISIVFLINLWKRLKENIRNCWFLYKTLKRMDFRKN